jgi:hypothetical protein
MMAQPGKCTSPETEVASQVRVSPRVPSLPHTLLPVDVAAVDLAVQQFQTHVRGLAPQDELIALAGCASQSVIA